MVSSGSKRRLEVIKMEMQLKKCINVYSTENEWIDFVFVIENIVDIRKAEEVISKAYREWWEDDEICDTIADYIGSKLTENNIEFEVYFKSEEMEGD